MAKTSVISEEALRGYLVAVSQLPRLGGAELAELLEAGREGDPVAWRELVEACLPWAVSEAASLRGEGRRFDALLRQANQVLFLALKDYRGPMDALEAYARARMRQTLVLTRRSKPL